MRASMGVTSSARRVAGYSGEVLADSPVAYWRLGESSGTTMVDSSGNARDGTYAGSPTLGAASLVTGDANTAVSFDGINDKATVTHGSWLTLSSITVEALIKPGNLNGPIIDRDDGADRVFQFRVAANKAEFIWWTSTSGPFFATGATTLTVDTRYHVAASFDGTTGRIYLNGVQDGSATATGVMQNKIVTPLVGGSNTGSFYTGVIDEAAYYGTALSSARILAHAQAAGV